jgi:ADP-dependent NAD(P)H-hydrate dehydratase / NAD(P)H-hydrate epimerase
MIDQNAILTVAQVRAAEQALFNAGTDPYALMRRAGEGVAEVIWRAGHKRDILVLCGPGNNGGDGYVIARALRDRGVPVRVAALAEPRTQSAARALADWAGPVARLEDATPATQIVDALFGIGLTRGLDEALANLLGALVAAASHRYAVDLPSGIDADSGALLSPVPAFDLVIAPGCWKPAHWLQAAAGLMRQKVCVPIGLGGSEAKATLLTAPLLAPPGLQDHKYTRGLVTIVAGVMGGAAALAAEAAARSGAGYVRLVRHEKLSASHAIVMTDALDGDRVRAILIGPGLGRGSVASGRLIETFDCKLPTVLDADALALVTDDLFPLPMPSILTPHSGEFDRLFGLGKGSKIDRTRVAAAKSGAVIVHKGADTVIAAPDGRVVVAPPASAWLSTAGTGDVLAGLVAGRFAVMGDPFVAACEAVWLHGEAARRAGAAFAADDLIAQLPLALESRL